MIRTTDRIVDFGAGLGLAMHTVIDEDVLIDDDGTITVRESAIPQQLDGAA